MPKVSVRVHLYCVVPARLSRQVGAVLGGRDLATTAQPQLWMAGWTRATNSDWPRRRDLSLAFQ